MGDLEPYQSLMIHSKAPLTNLHPLELNSQQQRGEQFSKLISSMVSMSQFLQLHWKLLNFYNLG